MPELILPKDHISMSSTTDLNDICAPLFRYTHIDTFAYFKAYPDNSLFPMERCDVQVAPLIVAIPVL